MERESGPRSTVQQARESAERDHLLRALEEIQLGTSPGLRVCSAWSERTCISASALWG